MKTPAPIQEEKILQVTELLPQDPAHELAQRLHDEIARRAYDLYCASGCTDGHDVEDWCQAESELLDPIQAELEESKAELTVRAPLRGFAADEITLWADTNRLFITAKHPETAHDEHRVFRAIELPAEIDARAVTAFLSDGVVVVTLPKLIIQRNSNARGRAA